MIAPVLDRVNQRRLLRGQWLLARRRRGWALDIEDLKLFCLEEQSDPNLQSGCYPRSRIWNLKPGCDTQARMRPSIPDLTLEVARFSDPRNKNKDPAYKIFFIFLYPGVQPKTETDQNTETVQPSIPDPTLKVARFSNPKFFSSIIFMYPESAKTPNP